VLQSAAQAGPSSAERCIRNIERLAAERGYMTGAQRAQIEAYRRAIGGSHEAESL
jgi:hypothetical protein